MQAGLLDFATSVSIVCCSATVQNLGQHRLDLLDIMKKACWQLRCCNLPGQEIWVNCLKCILSIWHQANSRPLQCVFLQTLIHLNNARKLDKWPQESLQQTFTRERGYNFTAEDLCMRYVLFHVHRGVKGRPALISDRHVCVQSILREPNVAVLYRQYGTSALP